MEKGALREKTRMYNSDFKATSERSRMGQKRARAAKVTAKDNLRVAYQTDRRNIGYEGDQRGSGSAGSPAWTDDRTTS